MTGYFFPEYNGTSVRIFNLVSRLPFSIHMLVLDTTVNGELISKKQEQFGNIGVTRFSAQPSIGLFKLPLAREAYTMYQKPRRLVRIGIEKHPDIIHAHDVMTFGQAACQVGLKTKKPFILELHALDADYLSTNYHTVENIYKEWQTKRLTKYSQRIITLTQSLAECISSRYKVPENKITVVPNGVDQDSFTPGEERRKKADRLKEDLHITGKVVMYSGYADWVNGVPDLISIIPQVIKINPHICFVFISHGPEEKKLELLSQQHPNNVKFLPMVPHSQMPFYYQMCDLFVLPRPSTPSTETLTPLKLLESMSMEKPVLGSNVKGITEVIKHLENGYLFEKGNLESFKDMLVQILQNDNNQIGRNARRSVMENYTWDKSSKTLQKVYEELGL
jgi:glycosyltransferase involved in cell wall biosynthesis